MRKALLILGLVAALAVPAVATAANGSPSPPDMVCGGSCDDGGGSGWSGCTQMQVAHSAGVWLLVSIKHYLIVNYCKSNGTITSLSIAAHGCDVNGIAACHTGPAWLTGGGVGTGWATFEAHASWLLYSSPYVTSTDVLGLTVPLG